MKNVRNLSFIKDNMPPVNFSPTGVNQFIQLTIYNIQRQTVNLRTKQVWKEVMCIYVSAEIKDRCKAKICVCQDTITETTKNK